MSAGVGGELHEVIVRFTVAPDAGEIVGAFAARDRLEARLVEGLVAYIASGGCVADGYRSAVGWLRAHVAVTDGEARALARRATVVGQWPTLAGLYFDGQLTSAQVAVIVAAVPKGLVGFYADHDAEVSPLFVGLCVGDTQELVRDWVHKAEDLTSPDPGEVPDPDHPTVDGFVHLSRFGPEERGRVDGELDADTATLVEIALDAAERPDRDGEDRLPSQRRAEALRVVCQFFVDHHDCDGGCGPKGQLVGVFDLADLYRSALFGLGVQDFGGLERLKTVRPVSLIEEAFLRDALAHADGSGHTLDGRRLSPAAITTIFGPGSTLERVLMADGQVLDHGRKVRFVKGPLRDLMMVRDLGCRFPSRTGERCDAPVRWIDGHHISAWRHDGTTSLANVAALCGSHHEVVHRDGWTFTANHDGSMTLTTPAGTTLTSPPPRQHRPPLPLHHPTIDQLPLLTEGNEPTASGPTASGPTASGPTASELTASELTANGPTASELTANGPTASEPGLSEHSDPEQTTDDAAAPIEVEVVHPEGGATGGIAGRSEGREDGRCNSEAEVAHDDTTAADGQGSDTPPSARGERTAELRGDGTDDPDTRPSGNGDRPAACSTTPPLKITMPVRERSPRSSHAVPHEPAPPADGEASAGDETNETSHHDHGAPFVAAHIDGPRSPAVRHLLTLATAGGGTRRGPDIVVTAPDGTTLEITLAA
jgi:hypothetical protein